MAIRKLSDSSDEGISLPQGKKPGPGVCLMLDGFDVVLEEQERDWFEEEEVAQDHGLDLTPENLEMVPGHDNKMSSAQYKGRTYSEVTCLDQEFTKWIMTTKHKVPDLIRYQTWLNTCLTLTGGDELRIKPLDQMVPPEDQRQAARPARPQCADGCKFSHRGSNAYVLVKTCTVCGFQEKSKKALPAKQFEYDNCPHNIWDWRGSSKKTSRKFCTQCHTFIAEMPQQAARERKKAGEELASSSEEVLRTSSTMMRQELVELSKGAAIACLKECAKQLQRTPEDKSIKASDLIKMLQENIDVVSQPLHPPVAHMAIGRRWADYEEWDWHHDPWYDEYYNWHPEKQMPIHGVNHELREIDILTDDGIWAILDEGCNTTCHSHEWRINAEKKLLQKGFTMEYCHSEKSYNGVGGSATKASMMFRIPFAIEVGPEYKSLAGVIESFELETPPGHFVPMLISLSNQATLGLVKDMRKGTATLKDYGVEIEICRARQNGLFCINIGALETATRCRHGKLPRHLRPLRIGSEDFVGTFCSGGSRRCLYVDSEDCMLGVGRQDDGLDTSSDLDLDAAAILDQEGEHVPPATMVGTVSVSLESRPPTYRRGGGWKDGPGAEERDLGKIYIVGTGYKFEETKRGDQRGGKNTSLPTNSKWLINYLNKLKGKRPTLGTKAADEIEDTIRTTFEWHLNGINSKASSPIWTCKGDQMYYEFVDMSHLKAPKGKDGKRHPGGGIKGVEQVLKDEKIENQLKELGNAIHGWSSDKASRKTSLVILVMDADDGMATMHVCQAIRHAIKKNWYDYSHGDVQLHLLEDIDKDCHKGTCTTCFQSGGEDLALQLVDKTYKLLDLRGYVNNQVHPDLIRKQEKKEKDERAKIAEQKTKEKQKEKARDESRRERSRSRGRRTFSTKELMPLGTVDGLTTEEKHTLCLALKSAGMMDEGINAMYRPGITPNRNMHEIVLKLELSPETILGMIGRQDVQKTLKEVAEYLESFEPGDRNHPYEYIFAGDTSQKEKEDEKPSKKDKRKKEKKKVKSEGSETEPEKKKSKKEEEPVEAGGLATESVEPEADYGGEDDEEKSPTDKPKVKEDSSESESVEDTSGLKLADESDDERRSPVRLTSAERPKSPERPPFWKSGDGKGKHKGKSSKGKSKNKSKAKFKHYHSDPMSKKKIVEMLLDWANKNQASWDEAKRNYMTWYEFRDFAIRAQIKRRSPGTPE